MAGKREETFKRDMCLVDFLKQHKGEENAVGTSKLCTFLNKNGFLITKRSISSLITRIKMEMHLPICYKRGEGFFWASCKEDILMTIKDMEMMIASLEKHIKHMQSFIIE